MQILKTIGKIMNDKDINEEQEYLLNYIKQYIEAIPPIIFNIYQQEYDQINQNLNSFYSNINSTYLKHAMATLKNIPAPIKNDIKPFQFKEYKAKVESSITNIKENAKEIVSILDSSNNIKKQIEEVLKDANILVGIAGEKNLSNDYEEIAKNNRNNSLVFLGFIAFILGGLGFANYFITIPKLLLALDISALKTFMMVIISLLGNSPFIFLVYFLNKYRSNANAKYYKYRDLSVQLRTLNPYLSRLNEEDKLKLLKEYAPYFLKTEEKVL